MFVPSGTMGNQVSVMTHTQRGDEIIVSVEAHVRKYEAGAIGILSGANMITLMETHGILDIEDVKRAIRTTNIHHPVTKLLCLENATSTGYVVPLEMMAEYRELTSKHGIKIHLDGARLFNAALALGVSVDRVCGYADSVMICVSKGLCAPVGSLVAGDREFIARARKNRKILGGGMRQAGILAAAGIIAIENNSARLGEDHRNARRLAEGLEQLGFGILNNKPDINIVFVNTKMDDARFEEYLSYLKENGVLASSLSQGVIRFVTSREVCQDDVDLVILLTGRFLSERIEL
jgi:threonine aldolase